MTTPGYSRPPNHVALLRAVVESARGTRFWKARLGSHAIESLADFERLPVTPAREYRRQKFGDLVAEPEAIEWIPGPWLGQSAERAPVAEGAAEARGRVAVARRVLSEATPDGVEGAVVAVVSTFASRYFGAEICAAFARMGMAAHLVTDTGTRRMSELLGALRPDVVAALSDSVELGGLPESVRGVVTVGMGEQVRGVRHVDLLVQNELGILGASVDGERYRLAHDMFHFEGSTDGALVVTPYFFRVQPMVRLDTGYGLGLDMLDFSG